MAKTPKKTEETKEENQHLPILANGRGLALRSMEDMWRFACAVRDSGLAPKSFVKPEQILIAIQSGAELGMPPMRSLQSFCVVHGNARLWGDAPLALVRQSGQLEYIKEWIEGDIGKDLSKTPDEVKAICVTKRKGDPEEKRTEFSVWDARRAGLWNKKTKQGYASVWMNYPQRMLPMRARALNLRDNFPDCFSGATIAEEYEGVEIPDQAPTPQVPAREERKQVEATVTDTDETIQQELEKTLEMFVVYAEGPAALDRSLDGLPPKLLNEIFTKFAGGSGSYTLEELTGLQAQIEHEGIPNEILALIPQLGISEEEATEHAKELFPEEVEK